MKTHRALGIALALACLAPAYPSGIDVEKLAPISDLAGAVDCAELAAACRCAERSDPSGGVEGAILACERSIAGRLDDYSSDLRWARIFVAGTGSARTACMTNQAADAGFPGGRQALWDALGLDQRHWRREQDVCWRRSGSPDQAAAASSS